MTLQDTAVSVSRTIQDDQILAAVSKQSGTCTSVWRRKDGKRCEFSGIGKTFQQCVKCKAPICLDCVTEGDHQSHIGLYGYEDV